MITTTLLSSTVDVKKLTFDAKGLKFDSKKKIEETKMKKQSPFYYKLISLYSSY